MLPVERYLSTSYRPDREYVDGEVVERNLGEKPHSSTQRRVIAWFLREHPELEALLFPEQRVQVSPTRFRVPDICVLRSEEDDPRIVRNAPLLCIEVLSKDDSLNSIRTRIDEYLAMGLRSAGFSILRRGRPGPPRALAVFSRLPVYCARRGSKCRSTLCFRLRIQAAFAWPESW